MQNLTDENQGENRAVKKWRWRRAMLLLAALIILTAGIGAWLTTSTSGLRWLGVAISNLSAGNVTFEGLDGKLSGTINADTLRFKSDDLLVIARDVQLAWQPGALRSGHLQITALTAKKLDIISPPSSQPSSLPDNLQLPLSLYLHRLDIGALRLMHEQGGRPVFVATELKARLESDGRKHRLSELRASLEFGQLTASGEIEGAKPFDLRAEAELAELADFDFTGLETRGSRISATITGNLEQLDVSAKGDGAGLTGEGEARLHPYAPLIIAGLRLSVGGLDPHAFSSAAPKASLALEADLRENTSGQLEGSLSVINSAPAPLDQGGLPLLQARADSVFSAEVLQLNDMTLGVAGGGTISGTLGWQGKEAVGSADLMIRRVNPARLDTRLRAASIDGKIKLSGDAENQQGTLALHDKALHVHVDAAMARTSDALTVNNIILSHGRSSLTGQGELGLREQQAFFFEGRLRHFDISAFVQTPPTDLNATLKLAGELEPEVAGGRAAGPAGTAHFKMGGSRVADQPVTGHGRIEFEGTARAEGEVQLSIGINHLIAQGGFGREGDQLRFELAAPALAQIGYGFDGSLTAEAMLENGFAGFGKDRFEWPDITFDVKGDGLTLPGEHHLGSFSANGAMHGEAIALKISATDYGTDKKILESLKLEVAGQKSRHEVRVNARLNGGQNLTLRAGGELSRLAQWQDARWLGQLSELSGAGQFAFHLEGAAPLDISARQVSLGGAKFAVAGGNARISKIEWTPQEWSSKGYFSGVGLRSATEAVKDESKNDEALRLGGEWDITSGTQLRGAFSAALESGDWLLPGDPPLPLGLQTLQLTVRALDGRLTGELKARGKRLGEVGANISVPVAKVPETALKWTVLPDATLGGSVLVDMEDISWAGPALGNNMRTGGRLALKADVIGTFGAPRLKGEIRGDELALALLEQGVRLEQGKLAARFDEESFYMDALDFITPHTPPPDDPLLKRLNLAKGPGKLRASGVMDFTGQRGSLKITANLVPLAQRPDRWIIASGNGRARLENNVLTLKGSLTADAGLITQPTAGRPHLPDDVIVIGQGTPDRQQRDRQGPRIDTEASLDLGEQFYIRASGLEGKLVGQLGLHGEPGQRLRAIGNITARNTSFEAYGQRLVVERGIVSFQGPLDNPGLNVLALRKGLPVVAGVEVTGTVRQPRVRLVSTPEVPDLAKLSWIALGRAPGGRADASLLLAAAASILGGQSGGVTDKISQAIGVDELSIRQAGSDALMGQIGVVGKRLSKRAYLSYEQGLTAVVGVTKLTYTLTPRITLVTRAGIDNAIDVLYSLQFD